jgi:hypothetical protein
MDNTTFDFACAVDFRMRAARYRRLARLYPPGVAAVLTSVANDLEAAADALEGGNAIADLLRPVLAPHAIASYRDRPPLSEVALWPGHREIPRRPRPR